MSSIALAPEPTLEAPTSASSCEANIPRMAPRAHPERPIFFEIDERIRAAGSGDGIVLLDLEDGDYHSLDPVAARVFQGLADGRSRDAIVAELVTLFDASAEAIEGDVDALLETFTAAGFIRPCTERSEPGMVIASAVPGKHPAAFPTVRMSPKAQDGGKLAGLAWLGRGLLALARIDLLTRRHGFPGVVQRLEQVRPGAFQRQSAERPSEPRPSGLEMWQIVAGVNRAASFYYRRRWCFERSAACAVLLRQQGFDAEVVVGVQVLPFIAHAWVEIDGQVINDNPELIRSFSVLHRL